MKPEQKSSSNEDSDQSVAKKRSRWCVDADPGVSSPRFAGDPAAAAQTAAGKPSRTNFGATKFATASKPLLSSETPDLTLYRPATLLWMAGFAILMVPMLTLVDVPVARWFANNQFPAEVRSALDLTMILSHGIGVFLILISIALMAPRRRWQVPRIAALALGGGSVATMAKLFVLRPRPHVLTLELANTDSEWLWAFDWDLAQVATFDAQTRAFPSGNVATATALIVGLWVVLPRGRWLFAIAGMGQLVHQVCSGSHFLSDLLGGLAVGFFWAYVCFSPRLLGSVFDKLAPESPRESKQRTATLGVPVSGQRRESESQKHAA